ncbi:tetratricopeptide repeat protein [Massilia sp. H-1]|nr:tetratricopeptide repeat protein [Massilia sp. H-1]
MLYREQGRQAEALSCFEESLSLRQRVLGEDHPDTRRSRTPPGRAAARRRQASCPRPAFSTNCWSKTASACLAPTIPIPWRRACRWPPRWPRSASSSAPWCCTSTSSAIANACSGRPAR